MTGKNNEELLNIYDDSTSNDLFEIDNNAIKEEVVNPSIEIEQKDIINPEVIEDVSIKDDNIESENITEESFVDEVSELENDTDKKKWFFSNIFKKKSVEETKEVDDETKITDDNDWSSNIFDDFNQDDWLLDEVDQIKQERDRDMFYYLNVGWKFFQVIFMLLIVLLFVLYSYIYVQNKVYSENDFDNQLLWPFCFILLDGVKHPWLDFCTSISSLKEKYEKDLSETKQYQFEEILSVIKRVYEIENFTKTKDVLFLQDKTEWKLTIIKILEEFDDLKNTFSSLDKQTIQCKWIKIDQSTKILTMNCSAYSAWYESWIRWFDGSNDKNALIKWTSISIANSFLNYINLESKVFRIVNRQKLFKAESIVGSDTGFTSKTSFTLKLKYNLK